MERETAFLSSFSGYMRLRPGPGLRDRVRRAAQAAADTPRDALSPAGIWIEDHARFLLDEAERLIRDTRFSPRLPACGGTPRALRWAREKVYMIRHRDKKTDHVKGTPSNGQ